MKQLAFLTMALVCFVVTVLLVAWPDILDLRRSKAWQLHETDGPSGRLGKIEVLSDTATMTVLPQLPDRALIYLRVGLQGDPEAIRSWFSCEVQLADSRGRLWLPLPNALGREITSLLGGDRATGRTCSQSLTLPPEAGGLSLSDQAFLVPADVVDDLRVVVHGFATLPKALSLPFTPHFLDLTSD